MIVYDERLKVFHSTLIKDSVFVSGFGTRMLGDGRKRSTMMSFYEQNDISYDSLIIPDQIHSVNIEEVGKDGDRVQMIDTTDGVITQESRLMLTVVTADCVPIMFADNVKGNIGISHQGWRGSLKKMVVKMLQGLVSAGSDPKNIRVAIGPSVNCCCYEMYGDRYFEFMAEFEPIQDKIFVKRGGKIYLSLPHLNFLQLLEAGVKKDHIDFFPFCTKCDKQRFFSFQRDDKEQYGEMFSFIMKS